MYRTVRGIARPARQEAVSRGSCEEAGPDTVMDTDEVLGRRPGTKRRRRRRRVSIEQNIPATRCCVDAFLALARAHFGATLHGSGSSSRT
jgi:hypothetical protein